MSIASLRALFEKCAYTTEKIVLVIKNATSAVFTGWVGTALVHSSGAFDNIVASSRAKFMST